MALHIIKLCVGISSIAELAAWQKKRLKDKRAKGQKADGDHCVAITCDSGSALGSDGACHKKPEPAPKRAVAHSDPAPRAPAAPSRGGGGKCFNFNGKQYCE